MLEMWAISTNQTRKKCGFSYDDIHYLLRKDPWLSKVCWDFHIPHLEITDFAVEIINLLRLLFIDSIISVKKDINFFTPGQHTFSKFYFQ